MSSSWAELAPLCFFMPENRRFPPTIRKELQDKSRTRDPFFPLPLGYLQHPWGDGPREGEGGMTSPCHPFPLPSPFPLFSCGTTSHQNQQKDCTYLELTFRVTTSLCLCTPWGEGSVCESEGMSVCTESVRA